MTTQSSASVNTLLEVLNTHSSQTFAREDIKWLFHSPKLADALNRVTAVALRGNDCVLGVHELAVYETLNENAQCDGNVIARSELEIRRETLVMKSQIELLTRQMDSMKKRMTALQEMSGNTSENKPAELEKLTSKIEDIYRQLHEEQTSLSHDLRLLVRSICGQSEQWMFTDSKHLKDVYNSDDHLLKALDNIGNTILTSTEDNNISSEMDLLSSQLADVQFRLFTAQVSHAYLVSLAQPPTPSRTQSNAPTNSLADLKNMQNELEALVSNCEEATQLIAKQTIANRVSETVIRGRVDKMEKELDGVQQIEEILEGMIGRISVAKEVLMFEISKMDAMDELLGQLSDAIPLTQEQSVNGIPRRELQEVKLPGELLHLQNVVGVRDSEDVSKILAKKEKLEKDLFEENLGKIRETLDEKRNILEPLLEALFSDSATSEIKAIDPHLLTEIREWERSVDEVKLGVSRTGKNDTAQQRAKEFLEKWSR